MISLTKILSITLRCATWHKTVFLCFCFFLTIAFQSLTIAAEIDTEQIEKDHKLETIRTQIKNVESSIETAKRDVDELFSQLRHNEVAAAEVAEKIETLQRQVSEKNQTLAELEQNKSEQETKLSTQRQYLAEQIRAAYKTGRNNYLKLILNQEQPDSVGRMLAYYDYDVHARSERITSINLGITEISALEQQIQEQTQAMLIIQQDQENKLKQFKTYRNSRHETTNDLQSFINKQGAQLQILQINEQELENLVGQLKHQDLAIQTFEDMPSFNSLRGQLNWPIKGRITSRFGSLRKGGKLKWQGVNISARSGVEVKAISTGKVVFADWFRNMGLLLILDHGDGFMSLYGHNERLLKKSGDWVIADDLIARVGDTGGQQLSGLYFEIRQSGNPIDPVLWCQN